MRCGKEVKKRLRQSIREITFLDRKNILLVETILCETIGDI